MARIAHDPELVKEIEQTLTGTDTLTGSDDVWGKTLTDRTGVSVEDATKVAEHNAVFVPAAVEAIGRVAAKNAAADKKLETVTGTVGMGAFGEIGVTYYPEKEVNIPPTEKGGKGTTKTSHGVVRPSVNFVAGRSGAAMDRAKEAVREATEVAFGKKK